MTGQPIASGLLDDVAPIGACGAGHGEHLSRGQIKKVQRLTRRQAIHRQRASLDMGRSRRDPRHGAGAKHDLFSVAAMATLGQHHAHHRVANAHAGLNARAHLIDDTGHIHAGQ